MIRVIKSERMRWTKHVAHVVKVHTGFWYGNLDEKGPLKRARR